MSEPVPAPRTSKRPSRVVRLFLLAVVVYIAIPMWWVLVSSTKSTAGLFAGTGGPMFFDRHFSLLQNLGQLFTQENGIFFRWMGNSVLYALSGGIGATVLAVLAGYGFAKFSFRGRSVLFTVLLGSVMVPATALVIPTFVLLSNLGLINTVWAIIIPSLLSPFGVYLMRVYAQDSVPDELLDAARMDGAGELRTFISIVLPVLKPATVTVFLLATVSTWNNYFLPLLVLSDRELFPVTLGLTLWEQQSNAGSGSIPLWNIVITGALVSVIPLIIAFIGLQRFWQAGISLGSVK